MSMEISDEQLRNAFEILAEQMPCKSETEKAVKNTIFAWFAAGVKYAEKYHFDSVILSDEGIEIKRPS